MSDRIRSSRFIAALLLTAILVLLPAGCSDDDDPTAPVDPFPESSIHTDAGSVGVILDARPIFRRGYEAVTAQFAFGNLSRLDRTIQIDQRTSLATFCVHHDSLSQGELAECETGTPVVIAVHGPDKVLLATHTETQLVLDDSNDRIEVTTSLPFIPSPVVLEPDMAYMFQLEGQPYLLSHVYLNTFDVNRSYDAADPDPAMQFMFTPVPGAESTYTIACSYFEGWPLYWVALGSQIYLDHDEVARGEFVLEQDEEGWIRIRSAGTDRYVELGGTDMYDDYFLDVVAGPGSRFRLLCDDIDWNVDDRGTTCSQPIMPPAQLDFAYTGDLINCAAGELTDTVGNTTQRSWQRTASTTDSFELFSSVQDSYSMEVGMSVSASVGFNVEVFEASAEVEVSTKFTMGTEYTQSHTTSSSNTTSTTVNHTETVFHTRDYTCPPYSAVHIQDTLKTIRDIRVPFTQVLRVTGAKRIGGRVLSGEEIRSQMLFNFVGGMIQAVGETYVDVAMRGYVTIDQVYEASTIVTDIEGACDD